MLERVCGRALWVLPLLLGVGVGGAFADNPVTVCRTAAGLVSDAGPPLLAAETVRGEFAVPDWPVQQAGHVASLPAPPTAIVSALIGFLCISLVHDGRLWLALLSSILPSGRMPATGPVARPSDPDVGYRRARLAMGCYEWAWVPTLAISSAALRPAAGRCLLPRANRIGEALATRPRPGLPHGIEPCFAAHAVPVPVIHSPLAFAQLARGPPWSPPFP